MIVESLKGKTIASAEWTDPEGYDTFALTFSDGTVYIVQENSQTGWIGVKKDTTK